MNIKKATLFIILIALSTMMSISCSSSKKYTTRSVSDVNKAAVAIKKDPSNEETIAKLLDAAEYGNSSVRAEALWVLGEAQIPQGYDLFLRYANDDPNYNVRQMAVRGIGNMPLVSQEGVEKIRVAMSDTSLPVQIEALEMAAILKRNELLPDIMKNVSSNNRWVKMNAIKSLRDYEGANVNKVLTSIRDSETDKAIAAAASEIIEYREIIGLI